MRRLITAGLLASAIGLGLLVLLWALSPPASAQFLCLYGADLASMLQRSGEEPLIELQISMGEGQPTAPALLAVNPDGEWTIYYRPANGVEGVCILAHGIDADPAEGPAFPKPIIPGKDS